MDESSLGWAVFRQARVLVILVAVSLVFLVVGALLAGFLGSSPSARQPVRPGLITAKVEAREIRSTVVARADVSFAKPVEVNPSVPEGASSPVVTGSVPKVGSVVKPGAVLLEISGRPIIALPGKFPAYRSLSAGISGPDVAMLRQSLKSLGYQVGTKGNTYDAPLAKAVSQLYSDRGYSAPGSNDRTSRLAVRDAQDSLADAKIGLSDAKRELKRTKSDLASANRALTTAKANLKKAQKARMTATGDPDGLLAAAVDSARANATSAQETVTSSKDAVASARRGVSNAERGVSRSHEAVQLAKEDALTSLPASEVVFLSDMPRRMDSVSIHLGDIIGATAPEGGESGSGAALVLSGNTIQVVAQVPVNEASLVRVGAPVELTAGDVTVPATVSSVCGKASASGDPEQRCAVGIELGDLNGVDRSQLLGNVQVTIQVGATGADALVAPLAAVSADAAGRARVQRVKSGTQNDDPMDPANLEWVSIEPGLSAEGMVEVKTSSPALAAGDLVVLGLVGVGEEPAGTETPR